MPNLQQGVIFTLLSAEEEHQLIDELLAQGRKWNDTVLTKDADVSAIRVQYLKRLLLQLTRETFVDDVDFNVFTRYFIEIVYMYMGDHYDTQFEQINPIQTIILKYYPQQRRILYGYEEIDDEDLL